MSAGRPRTAVRPSTRPASHGSDSRRTDEGAHDRFARRRRARRRRRWLALSALVLAVALVAAAAWAVLASSLFAVTTVEVVGTHRETTALVSSTADVRLGQPLARVDLGAVERRVATLPVVRSVVATRVWPHTVVVTVVERTPVATARSLDGSWRLIDSTGVDMAGSPTQPTGLVVLDLDPATADPAAVRAAAAVAAELPVRIRPRVRDIVARSPDDVRLALVNGSTVRWGSADDGTLKAQVLAALMTRPARLYDVSAPDAPTTR